MIQRGSWRNSIITLLIERPRTRREIHRALMPRYNPQDEARIDYDLFDLAKTGDVQRFAHGNYQLSRHGQSTINSDETK